MNTILKYLAAFLSLFAIMATAQAGDTIKVRFENGTDQIVHFFLKGGKGMETKLNAGQKASFTMSVDKDDVPAITIRKAEKNEDVDYLLADGGSFIFVLDEHGNIVNACNDDCPELTFPEPGNQAPKAKPSGKAPVSKAEQGVAQMVKIFGTFEAAFASYKSVEKYLGEPKSKEEMDKEQHAESDVKEFSLTWDDADMSILENMKDSTVVIKLIQLRRKIKGLETAVGFGSTRAEVLKALGKPAEEHPNPLTFRDGKSGVSLEFYFHPDTNKVEMWSISKGSPDLSQFLLSPEGTYGWEPEKGEISYDFFKDGRVHIQGNDGEATMWEGTWTLEADRLTVVNKTLKKTSTFTAAVDGEALLLNDVRYQRVQETEPELPPLNQFCETFAAAFDSQKSVEKYLGKPNNRQLMDKDAETADDEKNYLLSWDKFTVGLTENTSDSTVQLRVLEMHGNIKGLEMEIGIGSSREEVINYLGQPAKAENKDINNYEDAASGLSLVVFYDPAGKVNGFNIAYETPKGESIK